MKLICLNVWDGRVFDPLMDFIGRNADVDIFCLQEVFNGERQFSFRGGRRVNLFLEIQSRLSQHQGFFVVTEKLDDIPPRGLAIPYGIAIFAKNNITIKKHHHDYIFGNERLFKSDDARSHRRIIQTICIENAGKTIAISNVHGLWNGQGKTDTPQRVGQSEKIKKHIEQFKHDVVLTGDFNLLPDTKSLAIFREGMRDLVAEKGVTSTRSSLYTKPVLFADYIFTTPGVVVKDFKVLPDVVSDHLPLWLEFE